MQIYVYEDTMVDMPHVVSVYNGQVKVLGFLIIFKSGPAIETTQLGKYKVSRTGHNSAYAVEEQRGSPVLFSLR